MNALAKRLIDAADRFGLALMPKWRMVRLPMAEHLGSVFRKYGIDAVIDVGANVGQYGDFLRNEVGFEGWILSFEPHPTTFATLARHVEADERWLAFKMALGAAPGTATLHVAGHSTLNSLREPDFAATEMAALKRRIVQEEEVPVETFDRQVMPLLQQHGLHRPYLKMDTQGFDLEVLRGAGEGLGSLAGLQFEGSIVPLYRDMPSYAEMLEHLSPRGFSISGLFPVAHDAALQLLEFDCIMVSTNHARRILDAQ